MDRIYEIIPKYDLKIEKSYFDGLLTGFILGAGMLIILLGFRLIILIIAGTILLICGILALVFHMSSEKVKK
jgi:hypothetical protein